ncbi:gamma-glutamyltransferase [Microbotryum lychnidis-dioicae p1A1 Lamole]|uniref:Glutathione hydrolase n=1 Tax=Microbotryum lychnidis-dioicae (strain p1A1 Lamole / MvSl-1064) TaxID=683840 RepID=U5H6N8_USTV1|nr:gamma-glutamyltransferase [Microbotryum lychnidis-dioicae p1A1 Lamole]|eukprot:KDE06740.1 gamma-glutamyltransferase [Microbotryum lychnidis-dioicae p1A1 Lamole]
MTDLEQGTGGLLTTRPSRVNSLASSSNSPARRLRASSSASVSGSGSAPHAHEGTPLLSGALLAQRPSYRKRALSKSIVVESNSNRYWTRVAAGGLGLVLLVTGVVLIILRSEGKLGGSRGDEGDSDGGPNDTPDYSRLPPAKPGLRNPNYLVSGRNGAVATEVDICSNIGVDVLKENGTATDAAIASAICIGVTNMFSAGIGGGGFMVIRPSTSHANFNPRCTEPIAIDFRETAPSGSSATMFSPRLDDPSFDAARASKIGGLAVGVPGELRGLEAAYERCGGGVTWERLFAPSVELARKSKVGRELARRLNAAPFGGASMGAWMLEEEDWRAIFAPGGELLKEGEILRRKAYAETLETIGQQGAGVFYEGEFAESMVASVRAAGGILTVDDMRSYSAIVLPARQETYRNRTYYTGHYPSGGPIITHLLNILEGFPKYIDEGRTGLSTHRFVEALKFAFGARTEVGDPAYIKNSHRLSEIPTREYADRVRVNITDERTHTLEHYHPHFDIKEDHGTTHLSTVDRWGSSVSLTSTVNLIFGSRVMDKKTGVIMNDEMDDFATPGIQDAFGLRPSPFNYPAPGKRPLSSTAPMIMDSPDGEVWLSLGGSGGSRIFGAVAQVLLNLDFGYDLGNAVEQSRVHDQLSPAYVSIESGFREDLIEVLKERGHNTTVFDVNLGIAEVQAVMRDSNGRFFATSDSRKNGIPAAY